MVGGPYTTFSRANCDTPGDFVTHEYIGHGSGLGFLMAHWPSASFQDAPVAIVLPGDGYGHDNLWGSMNGIYTSDNEVLALAQKMSAAGWVVITMSYPYGSKNRHTTGGASSLGVIGGGGSPGATKLQGSCSEQPPVSMWPEPAMCVARGIQYVKGNYSGIDDENLTPFGVQLLGAGNSINPDQVALIGRRHGATLAAYVALQPSGFYSYTPTVGHDNQDLYDPVVSHRVNACVLIEPMLDFTQFHIATDFTNQSPAESIWQGDRWHAFTRSEDRRGWSIVPRRFKKQCPWYALQALYAENADLAFYTQYSETGFANASWDKDLKASDWRPGTVRKSCPAVNGSATAKAWIAPRHGAFQGPPWRAALADWASGENFGDGAKMRTSITRYNDALGDVPPYTGTTFATNVMTALNNWGVGV